MRRNNLKVIAYGLVGLAIGVASCLLVDHELEHASAAARRSYTVYIDPAFPKYQREEIVAAFGEWRVATDKTDYPLFFNFRNQWRMCDALCPDSIITVHQAPKEYLVMLHGNSSTGVVGLMDHSNIYLAYELVFPAERRRVLLHEVGHSLGLEHSGAGSIMCQGLDCMSTSITNADIEQYNSLRE